MARLTRSTRRLNGYSVGLAARIIGEGSQALQDCGTSSGVIRKPFGMASLRALCDNRRANPIE